MPTFDFSRINPRRLFRHNNAPQPAVAAAGSRSMIPGGQGTGGARPLGDSLQIPANRLPPAAPSPQLAQPASGSPPTTPIDIPAPRAFGPRSHVRFAGEDLDGHDGAAGPLRPRSDSVSNGSARSISPPPDYRDGSAANSEAGSPLNPYGSNSPPPHYHGIRLHAGESLLGHDGVPYPHPDGSPRSSGINTPSPLDIGTPIEGRDRALAFSGSPASMSSEQLEAYLNSLPPLSRFPTPPARD